MRETYLPFLYSITKTFTFYKKRYFKKYILKIFKLYQVHQTIERDRFPRWLHWDDAASTLLGVPSKKDLGNYHLSIKAIGKHGDTAKDQFIVQVIPEKQEELKHKDGRVS